VHESGAPAVREVLFRLGEAQTVRQIKRRAGVDHLVAPRRYALDGLLQDAAVRAGATLRTGVTVTGVRRRGDGRVVGIDGRGPGGEPVTVEADFVIGADGVRSRMAGWLGAEVLESSPSGTGTFYTYVADVPLETRSPAYEFHVARDAFAGIFPTHHGVSCVWLGAPTHALGFLDSPGPDRTAALLAAIGEASPSLAERVRAGRVEAPVRGRAGLPNIVRRPVGRRLPGGGSQGWALVGDAGYHRDAVTGHGISDAFRDAELLATALHAALQGDQTAMAGYRAQRDAALREMFDLTCALAAYPPLPTFVELHKRVGIAIDNEAATLAARPVPGEQALACA